jgi:hypothetical protein
VTGFLVGGAALALTVFYAGKALLFGDPVSGFPTLIVAVLSLGGLQLIGMGVLGEYLGRLFMEAKNRPLYLVDMFEPPRTARLHRAPGVAKDVPVGMQQQTASP